MEKKTWALIADASRAKIYAFHRASLYQTETDGNLELIDEFSHQSSRLKRQDLVTDKMGSYGLGSYSEPTDPKVHEAVEFAHVLVTRLDTARKENLFRDIILVSLPHFMGLLNKHMPHELQKLVTHRIEKDYTDYKGRELVKNLVSFL